MKEILYPDLKVRRDALRAANRCINSGPKSRVPHGEVVQGGRCQRCHAIKNGKRTA